MKMFKTISSKGLVGRIGTTILLMMSLGVASPLVHAATSGNATIYNEATVSYTSGGTTLTASANVSVTVITLAANPTVTVDSVAQTVAAGANAVYNYTLRSNANGVDTYNLSLASVDATVSASTDTIAASTSLWGGIVISSGVGTINLPGGSTTGLAVNDTVELTVGGVVERYTVTAITAGNAESSGVAEVEATLTLVPIAPTVTTITAANVVAGIQVGEYAVITLTQAAGTPTTGGTDGTHTNNLTVTSTATIADNLTTASYLTSSGTSNETITTVSSPSVTITKESRNVTTNSAFALAGTTAKPGEVVEYRITITNTHLTASTSNVYLTDDVPTYTLTTTAGYNGGANDVQVDFTDDSAATTTITYNDIPVDGDAAEVAGGTLTVTVGSGAGDAATPVGGTLDALDSAVVFFRVTVQ